MDKCEECEEELDQFQTPPWCGVEAVCELGECHCFECGREETDGSGSDSG